MSRDPLTQLQIADLSIKVPVQVTYALDSAGEVKVKSVSVVHGPLSLDITALLTEDDLFDIFEQLDNWYISHHPDCPAIDGFGCRCEQLVALSNPNSGEQP